MYKKKKQIILLIFLILILFFINYSSLDKALERFLTDYEYAVIERIIDGDTVVINGNTSVRLLGINSPERGEPYYEEAKNFLEMIILNKTVRLEFGKEKYDKYNRLLAYLFYKEKNVNLELVDEGLANFYFPSGKDTYHDNFKKAWEKCVRMGENLCENSTNKCAQCIKLKEFDWKNEIIILHNKCYFDCELTAWKIKDEGRKNFIFDKFVLGSEKDIEIRVGENNDTEDVLFWHGESYVWTSTGDTLFLRDSKGKLVLYESY